MDIKLLETEAEFRHTLALRNSLIDYAPMTYEEARERDRVRPPDRFLQRWVGYDGNQLVARLALQEHEDPDIRTFHATVAAVQGIGYGDRVRRGFEFLEQEAVARRAQRLLTETRDDHTDHLQAARTAGFSTKQRNPMSMARLSDLELRPTEIQLVEFTTSDRIQAELGEEFYRQYWEIHMEILRDVPSPLPYVKTPYADFRREFDDAFLDLSASHVARVNGEMVGVSEFAQNREDPTQGITYLTGVRRAFRRQGIARALKLKAMADAKSRGVIQIWTDNEEGNPMYLLNQSLGFKKQFEWHFMTKDLPPQP